jgi:hypothetical protein
MTESCAAHKGEAGFVIASAATQSMARYSRLKMDCVAALAMTMERDSPLVANDAVIGC